MSRPAVFSRTLSACLLLILTATTGVATADPPAGTPPSVKAPHHTKRAPTAHVPFLVTSTFNPQASYFDRIAALDRTAEQLVSEAVNLRAQGHPSEAEQKLVRALVTISATTEPESRAQALFLLGVTLAEQARWSEAEKRFQQAQTLFDQVRGSHSIPMGLCLRERARALLRANPIEAESLARQALTILSASVGRAHLETLVSVEVLSLTLLMNGKSPEAATILQSALHSSELEVLMPADLHGRLLSDLGVALLNQEQYDKAVPELQAAVTQLDSVVPVPNHDLAGSLYWLAWSFDALKQTEQAERAIRRALPLLQAGPHSDVDLADVEDVLADTLYDKSNFADAAAAYEKAHELHKRALGPESQRTLTDLVMQGTSLCRAQRCAQAEPLLRTVLDTRKRLLPHDESTSDIAEKLGMVLYRQGKYAQAEASYAEALAIRTELLGPTHASTVHLQLDVGSAQYQQGKLIPARESFIQALEAEARTQRAPDVFIANAQEELGEILDGQGDVVTAASYFQRAFRTFKQLNEMTERPLVADFYVALTAFEQDDLAVASRELTILQIYHQRLNPNSSGAVLVTDLFAKVLKRQHQDAQPLEDQVRELCRSTDVQIAAACAIVHQQDWITVCSPCGSAASVSRRKITELLRGNGPVVS